ncbi:hypothetical protein LOZ04_000790 [Ophidiomyces ophidiicola]|uniref:Uncharacterized protein n=1 Tax=Ophidiomyces ophidiicola TaxID=1387563 RepID=A0ACB8V2C4_9EURO|nr:uncharacterized protein LOZ57_004811 [Ophidiomyces ophidiicola]KAI1944453.1 hypothetical protein LOZ57_004811 [Ophidiomyces ophidiicola]KAI1958051.1 hypothetical protein LOZ56_006877 [Ophidiomyces ophidiicola]KAI1991149.1 hypothetical protein LOZ51_004681 [Ophidiomyces ophidiicola]KAI1998877.1 hypothetical protein LOZ49_006853 [Ophidiomyces ophidiicola]KAI2008859.1 hypothetical protein LOZ50_001777 [Ophidiomyces ophidiicola]
MMEYGTDNISGYAEENYSENPQVTMGQCSEPMAIRAGPLFDNAEFGLQQQQQRLSSESTHLTSRPSVPETQLHQSSHTPLGQSPLFGNVVSSEDYPRSTSSNPSLSPHPMELPASSLSSHYSPPLSSLPIISPSQSFDRPQFYPDGPPRDPNYSFPPTPTTPVPSMPLPVTSAGIQVRVVHSRTKPQCWDHGCNGREFSTFSNLLRHQREKAGLAAKSECPYCGTVFTRTTARNGHLSQGKCKVKRQMDEDQQMSGAPR